MKDPKNTTLLPVFKNGTRAASLERTKQGCRLTFLDEYVRDHQGKNFSFKMPIVGTALNTVGVGLPPYFAGLLPEGLRLHALIQRLKTSQDDLFTLLAATGHDPVGDIHFSEAALDKLSSPKLAENTISADFAKLQEQLRQGLDPGRQALSGVQEKISADRLSLPIAVTKKDKSYILKLSSSKYPDQIENEFLCLKIAKACGLKVNDAKIINDIHGRSGLLVERFDREWNKVTNTWLRFPQEDACQFLDRYPADKYIISFQEIAAGVAQMSTIPEIDIRSLLQLKAFSYLIGNGDLHAKNISLLQKEGVTQLAPCYDILCTALYKDFKMAMMFDGKNQNLKRKNFVDFGERYELAIDATTSMLDSLLAKFEKNKELLFEMPSAEEKRIGLTQMFSKRIQNLS